MKKKILMIVTAMVLAIAMMPTLVFAGTSSDEVKVTFSAGVPGAFDIADESITANGNLAEIFFPAIKGNEPDGVSFADVIVAAHIEKYGIAKVHNYLDISNGDYGTQMNKQFGHKIVGFYYRNGTALSGSVSDAVQNGDTLFAGAYGDYNYTDLFTSFAKKNYKATAGKNFSVKVFSDNWGTTVVPATLIVTKVNKATGKLISLSTTYTAGTKKGTAKTAIKTAGTHYISAKGKLAYESMDWMTGDMVARTGACVGALAKVTVNPDKTKVTKETAKKKQITLKWKKATGAKKYQVYRATKKNGKYKKVATTSKTSFTNKKLKKNKRYFYKVRAIATVGGKTYKSAFSAIVSVNTKK